jgi:hypothetical protein
MGFWRSLRQWWCWDGSPDTDPFRNPGKDPIASDVSGHAHTAPDAEPAEQAEENDA